MIIDIKDIEATTKDGYRISAIEEVRRVLSTKRGSIPMSEYGSNLYLYRDRSLDAQTKLEIISESFEAIERWVKQVIPIKVNVTADGTTGETKLEVSVESA